MGRRARVNMDARVLPVGVVLIREYAGVLHEVRVVRPDTSQVTETAVERGWWRYEYGGRVHKTLTSVARAITGDQFRAGNVFFNLRGGRRGRRRA